MSSRSSVVHVVEGETSDVWVVKPGTRGRAYIAEVFPGQDPDLLLVIATFQVRILKVFLMVDVYVCIWCRYLCMCLSVYVV